MRQPSRFSPPPQLLAGIIGLAAGPGSPTSSGATMSWVVATVVVVGAGLLTTTGVVVAIVMGLAVADFCAARLWFPHLVLAGSAATLAV